ncbi:PIN domain-containing protein [Alkalibacterium sp. f15]|uniref:PIN domain-containing protein n=1 Tax=Alkalibacterium sp. f15 TaxID=3414029 RepID=UPI003BF8488F
MNVFIDSNIWLGLYHFSSDDLSEFSKLKNLKNIKIYLPSQTKDEVNRNRIVKINDARRKFEDVSYTPKIPNLYNEFEDKSKDFRKLSREIDSFFKAWKEEVSYAINKKELKADLVIKEIFEKAHQVDTSGYYDKAIYRMDVGNPPGKNNSYGDAINWEALLDDVPEREDLFIITDDKDYYDDKKEEQVNSFLLNEWNEQKKSEVHVFNSLGSFFEKHIQVIHLKEEQEKNKSIIDLEETQSFSNTHSVIQKLFSHLDSFSKEQTSRIIDAAIDNSQIGNILEDPDIKEFYCKLLNRDFNNYMNKDFLKKHQYESTLVV